MKSNRNLLSLSIWVSLSISPNYAFSGLYENESTNTDVNLSKLNPIQLNPIIIQASQIYPIGTTTYDQDQLKNIPNSSKNLTDFLRVNPNAQFANTSQSALQQGELKPAEISINGALPYENKYLINGLSTNNNINPAAPTSSNSNSDLMGESQAVAINVDLLCNVTVLDSNISAEYGEFTGGVVKADTCAPTTAHQEIHGSISYDYTSDEWSKINYANVTEKTSFEDSTSESYQPQFTKQGISTSLYGNLNDYLGFSLAGSHRKSDIPLKTNIVNVDEAKQHRTSDNLALETFIRPSDKTQIKIGSQYLANQGNYFQGNVKDSDVSHQSSSQAYFVNMKNDLNIINLYQQLNYQLLKNSREGQNDIYSWLNSETKNWNKTGTLAQEGSFGQFAQEEKRLEYNIKAQLNPTTLGNINNQFKLGAGYGHYEAYWARNTPSYWYVSTADLNGESCVSPTGQLYDACDEGITSAKKFNGQYAKTRTAYNAGKISIQQDRWHSFIENSINYKQYVFSVLGVRSDYDSLTKQLNIAPRSAFSYQPFGNKSLIFTTGWNRYYGLNAFANELQDQKRLLQSTETRKNVSSNWIETVGSQYFRMQKRSQLDTPYSDETLFALNGQHSNIDWALKWVHRDNKDQIRKTKDSTQISPTGKEYSVYGYDNSGYSNSDIYTLTVKNINPLEFRDTQNIFSLAADYTKTKRNFSSYEDAYSDPNEKIYYDGHLINSGDRPADNFNLPWTIRTTWDININSMPLKISNFFIYKRYYDAMKLKTNGYIDEQGQQYDSYTLQKSPSTFQWDMRATYTFSNLNNSTILGLTINNVTNKKNLLVNADGTVDSKIGRQFIADLTFKF